MGVVAETVVEAWIDKARINFVFLLSTKIGNTYTYTRHVIDSKKRESQSVESENRVSRYSTTSSFILYHKSVVTKGTEQFLFLRHNNITHHHQKKVTFYFYIFFSGNLTHAQHTTTICITYYLLLIIF